MADVRETSVQVNVATAPAPGRPNEDLVIATDEFVIMLDGVTSPSHVETGCVHDPVWLVRTLGALLTTGLLRGPDAGLREVLAAAIGDLRSAHAGTCDLSHPESPSTTVAILRDRGDAVEHLVLCDCTVVFAGPDGRIVATVTDDRTAGMRGLTRAEVAGRRNADGGFWVASTDPAAAEQACAGTLPRAELGAALVCTDGVSRLVDSYGRTWPQVLAMTADGRVRAVIEAVRAAEADGPPAGSSKRHDDATLALCLFPGPAGVGAVSRSALTAHS